MSEFERLFREIFATAETTPNSGIRIQRDPSTVTGPAMRMWAHRGAHGVVAVSLSTVPLSAQWFGHVPSWTVLGGGSRDWSDDQRLVFMRELHQDIVIKPLTSNDGVL